MGLFLQIKSFIEYSKRTEKTDSSTNNSHNISVGNNATANIDQKHSHNNYYGDVTIIESSNDIVADNELLKVRIKEIRNLIENDKSKQALKELNELQNSLWASGTTLTVNDRFAILINIYTCYINIGGYDEEMTSIEKIIRSDLSAANEYIKFKYLYTLNLFKHDNTNEIIFLCEDILKDNPDYFKAKILLLVAKGIKEDEGHWEAIQKIDEIIKAYEMTNREKANAIIAKGDIALNNRQFDMSVEYYQEAYDLYSSLNYKVGIAMAYFLKAVREAEPSGFISFAKIDFDILHQARILFDEIYLKATEKQDTSILKQILPYYMNTLEFTEETEQILDLRKQATELLDKNQKDVTIITAHAELLSGSISEETIKSLEGNDKLKLELRQLALKGRYDVVCKTLTPLMDNIFKDDEAMTAMYLVSLFRTDDESFIPELKKYRSKNECDIKYELIWLKSLEFNDNIDDAKNGIDKLLKSNPVPIVVLEAYLFYEKHKLDDDLFKLSTMIVNHKISVRPSDLPKILKKHFFLLLDREDYASAEEFYNSFDFTQFKPEDKLQLEVEYCRLMGQLDILADKTYEYAKLVKDNRFIISSASYYAISNQIPKAIKILEDLRNSGSYEKSDLYMALARFYILTGKNGRAFESASKAKDIDKDLYKSPSHRFYVTAGLRLNKTDDSMKHMVEYHEKFPKEDWVRSGTVLKKDDEGNDVLDQEGLFKLIGDTSGYNLVRNQFFNYQIGLSTYMHLFNDYKLDFIIGELRYRNKKIKISEGYIHVIKKNAKLINDKILVDALALYVLADADILDILKEFEEVQVSYATIEFLEHMLLNMESSIVRTIMKFISDSLNIKLVPIKQALIHSSQGFLDETMLCMHYSKLERIPYVTAEFNLKNIYKDDGEYVVDIPTVLKALSIRKEVIRQKCTGYIDSLIRKEYTFISFNVFNVLDTYKDLVDLTNLSDKFSVYLSMSRFSEYSSYINIYVLFLNAIENELPKEDYQLFVDMIFDYLDWYIGRIRHYYNMLEIRLKYLDIKPEYRLNKWLSSSILVLSVQVENNLWSKKYQLLANDKIYIRLNNIVTAIMSGLYAFLLKYKENDEKLDFYYEHFRSRFKYIDELGLKLIFEEVRKHD